MSTQSKLLPALLFATGLLLGGGAAAQSNASLERALLDSLTPSLRTEVETRMQQRGQKVGEVIDTILLNKMSQAYAASKVLATDPIKGVVVVEARDGKIHAVAFDTRTLDIRPN